MHESERRRTTQRRLAGRIRVVDVVVFVLVLALGWLLIPSSTSDGDEPTQAPGVRQTAVDPSS